MKSKIAEYSIDALIVVALLLSIAFTVNQWRNGRLATADTAAVQARSLDSNDASTTASQPAAQDNSPTENGAQGGSSDSGSVTSSADWDGDPNDAANSALSAVDVGPADGPLLYMDNCAKCHGLAGYGDGPAIGSLGHISGNIALTNLGEQSDQQLFESISFGKGAEMPPWSFVLSDEERWALVDYVRTLRIE